MAAKGYDFQEVLDNLDAGRTPDEEEREISDEELKEIEDAIEISYMHEAEETGNTNKLSEKRLYLAEFAFGDNVINDRWDTLDEFSNGIEAHGPYEAACNVWNTDGMEGALVRIAPAVINAFGTVERAGEFSYYTP